MSISRQWLLTGTFCLVVASTPMVKAADNAAILARVQAADMASSLEDAVVQPWHLKVSFQLFDNKGKPGEQGTMEEWWSGPNLHKLVFTSPSYTATEILNQNGLFVTRGMKKPWLLALLPGLILHPMPQERELTDFFPELKTEKFGKSKLDCITLHSISKTGQPPTSHVLFSTYCLDDMNRLRLFYNAETLAGGRNSLGLFQQRTVALDLFVSANGRNLMTAHVTTLQSLASDAAEFVPTPDMSKPAALNGGLEVVAGRKISGPAPHYPEDARTRHVTGSVLLAGTIGIDGRIHDLEVISDPDDELSAAATEAVRQWIYKPYLLNGVPAEVDTTITINFKIGS